MRIRRNASRLLGCAVSAPPRFELPPPSGFELPPPAHESHAGFSSKTPSSSPEPCTLSLSPWDLRDQLDLSDPKEEERFMETYSVPVVAWRASWLLAPSMPAGSIDNDEEEDTAVDTVNGSIHELHLAEKNNAAGKTARKKKESKLKAKKWEGKGVTPDEEERHESWRGKAVVKKSDAGGRAPVWRCKKTDGKGWFCRRRVSRPDSYCWYHSDQKSAASSSSKPRRKRAAADSDEVFYFYAGFGPSRSTKRHRRSGSIVLEEPPLPAEQDQDAVKLPGVHIIEVQLPEEEHIGFSTAGQARADGANHQMAPAGVVNEPECDVRDMAGIAGFDEEISSDDDDALGCNGELAGDVKKRKSTLKKRRRKPVKARSVNALM